jgi:hypothetical protein
MGASFRTWLLDQVDRTDAIGELALNYMMDAEYGPLTLTADEVRQRMNELGAEPAFYVALEQAAQEWRALTAR